MHLAITSIWLLISVALDCIKVLVGAREPCNYFNTVRFRTDDMQITNSTGVVIHKNIRYKSHQYGYYDYDIRKGIKHSVKKHLRGCICAVIDDNGACIRPCRPPQIVYKIREFGKPGEFVKFKSNFSLLMKVTVDGEEQIVNLADIPNYEDRFYNKKHCERFDLKEYNKISHVTNGSSLIVDGRPELSRYHNGKFCLAVLQDDSDNLKVSKWYCEDEFERKRYLFGMLVSLPFLILTFLVYALIPELRTLHGKCLMCHLAGMTMGYTELPIMLLKNYYPSPFCEILACSSYYAIMLNFFWVNVVCFDIWWTFGQFRSRDQHEESRKFVYYLIYGFGTPLILALIVVLMDTIRLTPISPKIGANGCFFIDEGYIEPIYVYTPIGVLILANMFFFLSTAYRIRKTQQDTSLVRKDKVTYKLLVNFRLFIVMGIMWMLEVITGFVYSFAPNTDILLTISDMYSSSQGIVLFFLYVYRKQTRQLMKKKWNIWRGVQVDPNVQSSKTKSSVKSNQSSSLSMHKRSLKSVDSSSTSSSSSTSLNNTASTEVVCYSPEIHV